MKLLALLLLLANAATATDDPGAVAIDFLEKVRAGQINLAPGGDTALSPQTADDKREEIGRRFQRMTQELGSARLEVGAIKEDDNVAAVLVRKIGGFDPAGLQVFPIALVKRGAQWAVAPVPASFENAGLGYATQLRKRLEALENWMLREQVLDLATLREQSAARLRREIDQHLPRETFQKLSASEAAVGFLSVCQNGDLPAILGYLGGLQETLPNNWSERLKAADQAISAGLGLRGAWRLLISPEVVRVVVHSETGGTTALVSVACLDPADTRNRSTPPKVRLVHLDMEKGRGGLWQINPPTTFFSDENVESEDEDISLELDSDLLKAFPHLLRKQHPAAPFSDPQAAFDATLAALRGLSLVPLIATAHLEDAPEIATKAAARAAQEWWTVHNPNAMRHPIPLAFKAGESSAAAILQFLSLTEPDRAYLRTLYFTKTGKGWLWQPDVDEASDQSLQSWVSEEIRVGRNQWQDKIFADPSLAGESIEKPAPPEGEARRVVEAWLAATQSGDLVAALPLIARLKDATSSSRTLRNLGYEMHSARLGAQRATIEKVEVGRLWTLVQARLPQATEVLFPVYPVVNTAAGPRILLEIDLFARGNRGRTFLNDTSLKRAETLTGPEAAAELRALHHKIEEEPAASAPPVVAE